MWKESNVGWAMFGEWKRLAANGFDGLDDRSMGIWEEEKQVGALQFL